MAELVWQESSTCHDWRT